nr:death-associated protein kinase 2-like [Labrus bergylta]
MCEKKTLFICLVLTWHFGQVRQVRERSTGTLWAGKFMKIKKSPCSLLGLDRGGVEREVEILQAVQHTNIVTLRDVFESRAEVVLILELVSGGELFDFIAGKENLLESEAIEFMKQILEALRFMHSKNIVHFDLKVTSPEVINSEPLSTAADMWSIGVITYILLSGLSPFQGYTDEETLRNILAITYEFDDRVFSTTSSMAKDFIQKLLVKDPRERMTADESLLHPWIKPITRTQATKRNRSSINMKNFKKFNARRKWKMSYNMVWMCNRFVRLKLLCKSSNPDPLQRDCESDAEDTETKPASLLRRRLSSSS